MAAMATPVEWSPAYARLMFFMWWIMMIAMMLPSASPMIQLHYAIVRRRSPDDARWTTFAFVAGYLVVWSGFSAIAVALHWFFEWRGFLSPMMLNSTSAYFASAILIFAGIYKLTPLKQACLEHCRGPVAFLTRHWRTGVVGAFSMGLRHGAYCLGCCWGLMAILFFGGIMNLYWIVGLTFIVLIEKLSYFGKGLSRATGAFLIIWGAAFLALAVSSST